MATPSTWTPQSPHTPQTQTSPSPLRLTHSPLSNLLHRMGTHPSVPHPLSATWSRTARLRHSPRPAPSASVLYDPAGRGHQSLGALPSTTRVQRLAREQGLARLHTRPTRAAARPPVRVAEAPRSRIPQLCGPRLAPPTRRLHAVSEAALRELSERLDLACAVQTRVQETRLRQDENHRAQCLGMRRDYDAMVRERRRFEVAEGQLPFLWTPEGGAGDESGGDGGVGGGRERYSASTDTEGRIERWHAHDSTTPLSPTLREPADVLSAAFWREASERARARLGRGPVGRAQLQYRTDDPEEIPRSPDEEEEGSPADSVVEGRRGEESVRETEGDDVATAATSLLSEIDTAAPVTESRARTPHPHADPRAQLAGLVTDTPEHTPHPHVDARAQLYDQLAGLTLQAIMLRRRIQALSPHRPQDLAEFPRLPSRPYPIADLHNIGRAFVDGVATPTLHQHAHAHAHPLATPPAPPRAQAHTVTSHQHAHPRAEPPAPPRAQAPAWTPSPLAPIEETPRSSQGEAFRDIALRAAQTAALRAALGLQAATLLPAIDPQRATDLRAAAAEQARLRAAGPLAVGCNPEWRTVAQTLEAQEFDVEVQQRLAEVRARTAEFAPRRVGPAAGLMRRVVPEGSLRQVRYDLAVTRGEGTGWRPVMWFNWEHSFGGWGEEGAALGVSSAVGVNVERAGCLGAETMAQIVGFEIENAAEGGLIGEWVARDLWATWCGGGGGVE
ncbi:hypothetical protein LTR08_002846 [Meristemomyces frigidus]|nr:hypothetical protein LTR08_002846 [Meristemomyces frigidus]